MRTTTWVTGVLILAGALAGCGKSDKGTTAQNTPPQAASPAATPTQVPTVPANAPPPQPAPTGAPAASGPMATPAPAGNAPAPAESAAPPPTSPVAPPATSAERVAPAEPAEPAIRTYTVRAGTTLSVRTTSALSTKTAQSGDPFTGSLEQPLRANGTLVAPRGSLVHGTVVTSDPGGRVKGRAYLSLRLNSLTLPNGRRVPLTTSTYGQQARSGVKKDALKVGGGAALGALIGGLAGGGKGAGIGALAGGGAGTGYVLATHGEPAVVPSETVLTFILRAPVSVRK